MRPEPAPAGEPAPISVMACRLLAEGIGDDYLKCPGLAPEPAAELEERARRGFCVAIQPRGHRDLFHDPAPLLIGSAYQRPMPEPGEFAELLQQGLLEPRTAHRPPLLLGLAARIWNWC